MVTQNYLIKLIKANRSGRTEIFTSTVREIAASMRKLGNVEEAEELEKALVSSTNPTATAKQLERMQVAGSSYSGPRTIPLSKGDQFPLLELRNPNSSFEEIITIPSVRSKLDNLVREQEMRSKLAKYGLAPITRILFYGPPGCGKTLAADVVASQLSCPLLYVRFDSVISSYLGETSSNLRRVFDYATNGLSVLFFDEFDAIGKSRDSMEEVGELKRVVNSFLQMMDNFQGKSIVIAATNHEGLLDNAVWRRFDDVVFFGLPKRHDILALLKLRLGGVKLYDFTYEDIANLFVGLSYSDISKICIGAIKKMIIDDGSFVTEKMVKEATSDFIQNRPNSNSPGEVVV